MVTGDIITESQPYLNDSVCGGHMSQLSVFDSDNLPGLRLLI